MNTPKLSEIRKALVGTFDSFGKKLQSGNFIVRREFFYTHGRTAEDLVKDLKAVYPAANIVDKGEVWKPFRGGASTANSSYWYVEFNFKNTKTVELKVRTPNDKLTWETRKVETTFDVEANEEGVWVVALQSQNKVTLTQACAAIAKQMYSNAVETRWNFAGVDQGHYNFVK